MSLSIEVQHNGAFTIQWGNNQKSSQKICDLVVNIPPHGSRLYGWGK